MLRSLRIENFALIERAEVAFAPGATIFSGETGSGKTMLVGALAFALGARSDLATVPSDAKRALVELAFEPDDALVARLKEDGFELEPGEEAALLRELTPAGKSSLRLCGRSVTASYVRDLAPAIAEIIGQHEAQRLLAATYHLELLDRFAGADALATRVAMAEDYARVHELRERLAAMESQERTAIARFDEAAYAVEEIRAAAPQSGEDERLNERRRYLDNVERIASALRGAHEALADDDASAVAALGTASAALAGIGNVAPSLAAVADELGALQSEANELAARIARELEATEYDAGEVESVNARLDLLDRLKRKYGATIEAVLARASEAQRIVSEHEQRDERSAELQRALAAAEADLAAHAKHLSALRRAAAKKLVERVRREFGDLALGSGSFEVSFDMLPEISASGAERAEFMFSANAGEPARPLARVVSGGELSRVLLALVVVLAEARERTALVFDEIDAGIGGETAVAVGARIGRLARSGQVLCITHLAQLARWADRHYVLEKHERKGVTTIGVREVASEQERASEIARMLSGESHDAALRHARKILKGTIDSGARRSLS